MFVLTWLQRNSFKYKILGNSGETIKMKTRKTYASRKANYELDPNKVGSVIGDIESYIHWALEESRERNPKNALTQSLSLRGEGRVLFISAEAVDQPGFLTGFDVAQLDFKKNGGLVLKVNEHLSVTVPSEGLHKIGTKYSKK